MDADSRHFAHALEDLPAKVRGRYPLLAPGSVIPAPALLTATLASVAQSEETPDQAGVI